jgi:hypothetical protein
MPIHLFEARHSVQANLGCAASAAATTLYLWAGEIVQQLEQRNGIVPAKLLLAEALGITTDLRWRGANRDGPVEPRHRVVARFARENRIDSLWSLNWDCLQENALERVGLSRRTARVDLPWKTHFRTFITVADYDGIGGQQSLAVFKPHGCVYGLTAARAALDEGDLGQARQLSSRFLITEAELRSPDFDPAQNQQHLFANLETRLAQSPLIVLGWRISEEYLCQLVEQRVGPVLRLRPLLVDQLSIVDLHFNDEGHQRVAAAYGFDKEEAHVPVEPNGFTMDSFWLWLQALYYVQHVRACNPNQAVLDSVFAELQTPCTDHWIMWWADEWLPGWCRLCWRFGSVTCIYNNTPVPPEHLDLEAPDAHVPLNLPNSPRPDLVAAGDLATTLFPGPVRWDFRRFPGALFDKAQGQLVLPVPTWHSHFGHAERALGPLVNLWKPQLWNVRRVSILGLDGGLKNANGTIDHWRQALARTVPVSRFADPQNITALTLNQL